MRYRLLTDLTLIPKGVPLMIKAIVENQDIGFITKEMEAAVKINTFDFQKYLAPKQEFGSESGNNVKKLTNQF